MHAGVEPAAAIDRLEQAGEEPDVGVGADQHRVADPALGGLDAPRVDEHDARPAAGRPAQLTQHVGDRVEARLRRPRVLSDDQAQVGVLEVGDRVDGRGSEDRLAGDELVGAVLRARGERPAHAERPQQGADVQRGEGVERRRVPDVGADGVRAVLAADRLQPRCGVGHGVVPPDGRPRPVGRSQQRRSRRSGSWLTSTAASPLWQAKPLVTGCSRSGFSATSVVPSTSATRPQLGSQIRQNVRTSSIARA